MALPIDPDLPPPLGDAARDLAFRRLSRQAVRFPQMEIAGLDDSHSSMRTIDGIEQLSEKIAEFGLAE